MPSFPPVRLSFVTLAIASVALTAQAQSARSVDVHAAKAAQDYCDSTEVEGKLKKRETDLLGSHHALQHAQMRAQQCEVKRGVRAVPGKDNVKNASDTKKADDELQMAAAQIGAPVAGAAVAPALAAAVSVASTQGQWSDPFIIPVVGVAAVLLHTGKVMFWSYDPVDYHNPDNSRNGVGFIWDPATRAGYNIPPPENIWCAAQTVLADGRVYVAGGNLRYPDPNAPAGTTDWMGLLSNYTFNPISETWARQPDMTRGRWYPTTTQLADNRVVITSGIDETGTSAINNTVEIFTPDPNMDGIGQMNAVGLHDPSGLYPLQFLLPSGSMLEAGPARTSSYRFDPVTNNWNILSAMRSDHYNLGNGISYTDASLATPKQVVMVAGGHDGTNPQAANEWFDGYNPTAGWRAFPLWKQPRRNSNTVILPDGKLLTVGGNSGFYGYQDPVFTAELYSTQASVTTGVWNNVATSTVQAAYHSSAILLPDATVLLSQDDMDSSAAAAFEHKAQVYSPPYLFKGARPVITAAPAALAHGQKFQINTNRSMMTSAMLVAPGATTHGNDMHQRAIKLPVTAMTNGLNATVPASSALVPPGYYMLFVIDSAGIPSVAKFVKIT